MFNIVLFATEKLNSVGSESDSEGAFSEKPEHKERPDPAEKSEQQLRKEAELQGMYFTVQTAVEFQTFII